MMNVYGRMYEYKISIGFSSCMYVLRSKIMILFLLFGPKYASPSTYIHDT